MVDEGRVARLLRGVNDRLERLRAARTRPTDTRDDLWLDGVKYLFVTTIEGCIDVAQHIASSEGFGPPDSNAEAVKLLGTQRIIASELADELARAVGFRNILVHRYTTVDDTIVLDSLDRLERFDDFVGQVSAWLLAQPR